MSTIKANKSYYEVFLLLKSPSAYSFLLTKSSGPPVRTQAVPAVIEEA
jgi:hypothetical protein